ncbi:DNA-directed RNA polymerase subunit K [Candidatus Woesearchaeota archaeon]|nr:DNA-directed RNA polymerase subunit K [Candidatus Woesearchaeota archaeon]MBW3017207.1 DNA-directed RNA polymerase subunit K [Candidatus Woesearchaeota archaeon]
MAKAEETPKQEFSKFEKARIVGARALQISMGAPFLVKLSKEELEKIKYNPVEIAKKELEAGLIPIRIKRPVPQKKEKAKESKE